MTATRTIVIGAGIIGLWQALTLARRGFAVTLCDSAPDPVAASVSRHAGAMLAPDCEAEAADPLVSAHGREGLALWRETYPGLVNAGTLVVAAPRDLPDLTQFAHRTSGYRRLDDGAIAALEPDLGHRFPAALYYPDEAHMTTPAALTFLIDAIAAAGGTLAFGASVTPENSPAGAVVIDCRGMAARDDLANLRGVRGERLTLRTPDVTLSRPVRLLHPRHPIYIVPWSDQRFLVGATMIESEDAGPITVRSALDLLGAAYALNPAFAEAEILEAAAGVRPAFPDNVPRAVVRDGGRHILVNGAYRHGFLLAPVLADAVASWLESKAPHPLIV